jgi:hypothetical protein
MCGRMEAKARVKAQLESVSLFALLWLLLCLLSYSDICNCFVSRG